MEKEDRPTESKEDPQGFSSSKASFLKPCALPAGAWEPSGITQHCSLRKGWDWVSQSGCVWTRICLGAVQGGRQGQGLGAAVAFPGQMPAGAEGAEGLDCEVHKWLCQSLLVCTVGLWWWLFPLCRCVEERTRDVRWTLLDGHRCGPWGGWKCHLSPLAGNGVKFLHVRRNGEFGNFDKRALKFSLVSKAHS